MTSLFSSLPPTVTVKRKKRKYSLRSHPCGALSLHLHITHLTLPHHTQPLWTEKRKKKNGKKEKLRGLSLFFHLYHPSPNPHSLLTFLHLTSTPSSTSFIRLTHRSLNLHTPTVVATSTVTPHHHLQPKPLSIPYSPYYNCFRFHSGDAVINSFFHHLPTTSKPPLKKPHRENSLHRCHPFKNNNRHRIPRFAQPQPAASFLPPPRLSRTTFPLQTRDVGSSFFILRHTTPFFQNRLTP